MGTVTKLQQKSYVTLTMEVPKENVLALTKRLEYLGYIFSVRAKAKTTRNPTIPIVGPWPSVEELVAKYNKESPSDCPAVSKITEGRIAKARKSLGQFPEEEFWTRVFANIHHSKFLRKTFKGMGFDWLMGKKDGIENAIKVYENQYCDE